MTNFKKKIVVIDGLARSGTTLLATIINSQKNSLCYRGIFHEFLACNIGTWKKDYILHSITSDGTAFYLHMDEEEYQQWASENHIKIKKLQLEK